MLSFVRYLAKRAAFSRFRKDTSGVTIVEFAMIVPLFFLMLGIIIETGLMMFTEYVLQTSVQEAARLVRTGQAQEMKLSPLTFKAKICRLAKIVMNCNNKISVYMKKGKTFADLAGDTTSYLDVGIKPDGTFPPSTFDCGQRDEVISLIATYDWNFQLLYIWNTAGKQVGIMSYFGNINGGKTRRMAAFAMFKNEPFPAVPGNTCAPLPL
jgi:Flp pilus assembly pilin Flp